jgi:S-adenosylmethionine decarboxylase
MHITVDITVMCFYFCINEVLFMENKLKLYGFNNLTKSLSFNIYDVCYAKTQKEQLDYIAYIDEQYNSERITDIMTHVTEMIGAQVLSISKQDYDPQGASATFLIADDTMIPFNNGNEIVAHLDKSHVTVHTYPEFHPDNSIATFRVDIDVATCGKITPLTALDYLIGSFDSDIITMDYRVRGFTRNIKGEKLFIDHDITSIQDYIDKDTLRRYDAVDINVYDSNIFHTKMLIKELYLQNYLFNTDVDELPPYRRLEISTALRREMIEIFSGRNVY